MSKVLVIYTGGTIGMVKDASTGALKPFEFEQMQEHIPILQRFPFEIDIVSLHKIIDSSDAGIPFLIEIAEIIQEKYNFYDGFVVLHGTDTMAYTASALSFLLENLQKPVVLTGSQLPIDVLRTDGRENLVNALMLAADKETSETIVPEVCIYFENELFRGNRTLKVNTEDFEAFRSPNYPVLADVGVHIKYHKNYIRKKTKQELKVWDKLDNHVALLRVFPGMHPEYVKSILKIDGLKGLVLETFGSGNVTTASWFKKALKEAIHKDLFILNISQCISGAVNMRSYEAGKQLMDIGVLSGFDMTTEAAITKLMFLLGNEKSKNEIKNKLQMNLQGEMNDELS